MQSVPLVGVLPLATAAARCARNRSQLLGQIPPPAARVEHEQDPFQRGTVIDPRLPTRPSSAAGRGGISHGGINGSISSHSRSSTSCRCAVLPIVDDDQ